MIDSVINGNGNSRYLKSVSNFLSLYPDYSTFANALINGTLPIDLYGINQNGFTTVGTPINKATLVDDTLAQALDLDDNDPDSLATPNNAFKNIWKLIYPIGSEYVSTSSTSPAFGGTWEQKPQMVSEVHSASFTFAQAGTVTQTINVSGFVDNSLQPSSNYGISLCAYSSVPQNNSLSFMNRTANGFTIYFNRTSTGSNITVLATVTGLKATDENGLYHWVRTA